MHRPLRFLHITTSIQLGQKLHRMDLPYRMLSPATWTHKQYLRRIRTQTLGGEIAKIHTRPLMFHNISMPKTQISLLPSDHRCPRWSWSREFRWEMERTQRLPLKSKQWDKTWPQKVAPTFKNSKHTPKSFQEPKSKNLSAKSIVIASFTGVLRSLIIAIWFMGMMFLQFIKKKTKFTLWWCFITLQI